MGVNAKSFDGCRAVVSDKKTGASIADTAILFHDMSRNILSIGQNLFQKGKDLDKVNVLAKALQWYRMDISYRHRQLQCMNQESPS